MIQPIMESDRPLTDSALEAHEWHRGAFTISTERGRLDLERIHEFLASSYWAKGVTLETVRRSIEHSLPFGVFAGMELVGFGRVITDYATFAYIADVFVMPAYRKRGLGKWLIEVMLAHPALQGLRSWGLKTREAQALYRGLGFGPLPDPNVYMTFRPARTPAPGGEPGEAR